MFPGGIAGKLGNRYEAKWLVRQLLDVIAGKAEWLRFEGITPQFAGFEFAVNRGVVTEWHQTKENAPNGNWTIKALERENVLSAFKNRLEGSIDDRCLFVSQDPAKDFRTLIEKARIPNNSKEFIEALSDDQKDKFNQLTQIWEVDDETGYAWLNRCESKTVSGAELDDLIATYGDLYFANGESPVFPLLREYAEVRFNKVLTTEIVRAEIRNTGPLVIKDWSLDPTLRERLRSETDAYLQTYTPFGAGGSLIPRRQTHELFDNIGRLDGPSVILLTGVAGSGKSGVVRGLIGKLREFDIPHLALRVDHHLNHGTPQEIGQALTGRIESPVSTLKGLEPERLSVLIVDQVDAVSEVSGRSGGVKEAVLRMVSDAGNLDTVRIVIACRSFDLDSDPRLKALKERQSVQEVEVPLLEWDNEVAPLLAEKGIDITSFSQKQKSLLCLPLNLAVFFEAGSEGKSFASRNDLFEILMQRKERTIKTGRSLAWAIAKPLTALADWMSARQILTGPETVLDDFPNALDLLTSEGLIVRTRGLIHFFHESFFDYIYARAFVGGNQSLINVLTSSEQHLFRRTQIRQILEALRQNDRGRYFRELEAVLTAKEVRFHIKAAVAKWLSSLSDPTQKECSVVLCLDDENEPFRPLVRHALFSSAEWFDLLNSSGWIHAILNGKNKERQQSILWWLSAIAGTRPAEVADILNVWWADDSDRGKQLLDWFGFVRRQKPDQALLVLCEKVIKSNPPGIFEGIGQQRREMLLSIWAEKNSQEKPRILKTIFDTWFDTHPGQHPFMRDALNTTEIHYLGEIAKKSPKSFIEGTIEALIQSIDIITRGESEGEQDASFRFRIFSGSRFREDEFLGFFRSALRQIAAEDPNEALQILSRLDASKHQAFLHLHLETVSANAKALAHLLLDLLGNKDLFKAGWHDAPWKSFANAARVAFPYLSRDERSRAEKVIFSHRPEIDLAIKGAHEIKLHGEAEPWCTRASVIWDINRSGFEQWCILESIGEDLLTDKGLQRLKRLRRKFPRVQVPEPKHMEAHKVGSPIKRSKARFMNDENWLRAIDRYNSEEERRRGRGFTDGGARQLAGELQHATKENPARFVALMKRIPHEAHQAYVSYILMGVKESEDVDEELLKEAIIEAHARPERLYGEEIAQLFEKHPHIAKDPAAFDILAWYIENGEANEDEEIDSSNTEHELISINDLIDRGGSLHIRGINGARGWAAEALEEVLWKVPEIAERAWEILERRIEGEQIVSVRCCLIRSLVPLFNVDRLRCAELVERLVEGPSEISCKRGYERPHIFLSPLITHQGTYLLPYLLHWVRDTGERLLNRLLNSGDETMRAIGAWHVFRRSFQDPTCVSEADLLIEEGPIYRRLAADVASEAITSEEFQERAKQQVIRFFDDADQEVRRQASDVFQMIMPSEFAKFSDLAWAYLASRAFNDESSAFFSALEKATTSVYELVINAAEKLLTALEIKSVTGGRRDLDLDRLQDLLKREYAASENDPELRGRLLDVIDKMLEKELYGAEEIVKAHERE